MHKLGLCHHSVSVRLGVRHVRVFCRNECIIDMAVLLNN